MYLVANFKAHSLDIEAYIKRLSSLKTLKTKVVLAPPYPYLLQKIPSPFPLCSQDVSAFETGPYTGEVPAHLLKSLGASYCLIGHSERRRLFHEDKEVLKKKFTLCLNEGLQPIFCVGETQEEHEKNLTLATISHQLLDVIPPTFSSPIIAYEPIWSIGSGKIPEASTIAALVENIKKLFPNALVLYGGSVNAANAKNLAKVADGLLVGSASNNIETFIQILQQLETL
ncbi:triosephosphate isomerase [bacterium]|jgi:triosephosphate isomerase|nr:triosephosphate isomerase [bacterium]